MSIVINNLTKTFGTQKAVDDVSFEVKKGEVVGFLGPNGAGKSTTMKMITCYIIPTSGSLTVNGFDIYKDSINVRKQIGYLPEHNPLYHEMYIKEYLNFVADVHKIKNKRKKIKDLIELTGLTIEQTKKIGALSKGYRQRLGLAQALIHDPPVLILDEPTSGLDPNQIVDIRSLIIELGKTKTVILSSHIMQEVQAMCNRIVIINSGKVVADNTTEKLISQIAGKTTIKVKFKNQVNQKSIYEIKGVQTVDKKENIWYITTNDNTNSIINERLFLFAANSDNVILELSQESQNLEKVFQKLTN